MKQAVNPLFFKDLIRGIALLFKTDWQLTILSIFLQFLLAILPVSSLYFLKLLIEAIVQDQKAMPEVIFLVGAFGVIQLLTAWISQYSSYIATIQQLKLADYLSGEVLQKAVEVDYEFYENPAYHDTLHLAQQQSLYKAAQLSSNFNALLLNSLSLLFLIGFFFSIQSLFALIFVLLSVPLSVIKWYYGFELLRLERKFAPLEREANYLYHTLTGVSSAKEVRVFGFADSFAAKFRQIRSYIFGEKIRMNKRSSWYSLVAESFEVIAMTIIFGLLAKYAVEKTITIGVFVIYIQGFQRLQSTSKGFLQAMVQVFQQRVFLKDLFIFLDLPASAAPEQPQSFPKVEKGLWVENVSFTYPQTGTEILHQVSVSCLPGKIIAIVGENGSGKSTLVKLLARLYRVQSGSIRIDDASLENISMKDYRDNTVFLFQDFEKYFLTIKENIALGENDADKDVEKIKEAAILSGAHSFISKLAKGYETRMGRLFEGSEQLSGGQWQKLALARIFYKKSQLVIIDEPTSALDALAESELFRNVKEKMKDKMVVLISHRLYNLKLADYIYVMKEGAIAEEGDFNTLISNNGLFRKLYDMQKL